MRVDCTSTLEGHIGHFYRTERNVTAALKPIVPILLASHADIVIGRVGDDPLLLMRVGPISGNAEITLLNLIESRVTNRRASFLT